MKKTGFEASKPTCRNEIRGNLQKKKETLVMLLLTKKSKKKFRSCNFETYHKPTPKSSAETYKQTKRNVSYIFLTKKNNKKLSFAS